MTTYHHSRRPASWWPRVEQVTYTQPKWWTWQIPDWWDPDPPEGEGDQP